MMIGSEAISVSDPYFIEEKMNINLQPRQFLFIYNCIKKSEKEHLHDIDIDSFELYESVVNVFENEVIHAFEEMENKVKATGFDKWLKSEKNKIQGLEEEIKKIQESVKPSEFISNLKRVPVNKTTPPAKVGRPRKK
jgi:hypothetical protein